MHKKWTQIYIITAFLLHLNCIEIEAVDKSNGNGRQTYRDKDGSLIEIEDDVDMPEDEDIQKPEPQYEKAKGRSIDRSTPGKISNEKEVDEILLGVSELKAEDGTFGALAILKKDVSFPILTGKISHVGTARINFPIMGGALFGKGRIIIYASDDLAFPAHDEPNPLISNAIKWVGADSKRIAVYSPYGLTSSKKKVLDKYSAKLLSQNDVTSSSRLSSYDVIVLPYLWELKSSMVAPLQEYVKNGGGLLGCMNSWYRNAIELRDGPANKLLGDSGLYFLPVSSNPTKGADSFDASKDLLRNTHSELVIDELPQLIESKDSSKEADRVLLQVGSIVKECLGNVDKAYIPWLQGIETIVSKIPPLNPTTSTPEKGSGFKQFQVDLEWTGWMEKEPKDVKPHPGHAHFPGEVKSKATRVPSFNRTIPLDQRHAYEYEKEKGFEEDGAVLRDGDANPQTEVACMSWCSTTMYAPAGEEIEVVLHSKDIVSFNLLIGCHTDDLRGFKDNWVRYPTITFQKLFIGNTAKASSPFGGLVFVKDVVVKGSLDNVVIEVKGAVATNSYIYNETSLSDWNGNLKNNNDAPWAEFISERLIFSIPTENASAVENPEEVMKYWVTVIDAMSDMAGYKRELNFHRIVFDIDITQGFMHSGNPIVGFMQNAMNALDLKVAHGYNGWVFLHEIGHNHQKEDFTMAGFSEVTNLIFASYVGNTVLNITMIEANHCNPYVRMVDKLERYLKLGDASRFYRLKGDKMCGIGDIFFYHLEVAYGWEPFKKLFRAYRKLKPADLPKTDEEKWSTFFVTFSNCVGKNLEPLFTSWGIPLKAEVKEKVATLPTSEENAEKFATELKAAAKNAPKDANNGSPDGQVINPWVKRLQKGCLKDVELCKSKYIWASVDETSKLVNMSRYEQLFGKGKEYVLAGKH